MSKLARRMAAITPFRVVDVMEAAWAAERAGRNIIHLEVGDVGPMKGSCIVLRGLTGYAITLANCMPDLP